MHKANIMKLGDGLWMKTAARVFENEYKHSGLQVENMIVDNMAMQLVSRPQQFDVMVMVRPYYLYIELGPNADVQPNVRIHRSVQIIRWSQAARSKASRLYRSGHADF